MYTKCCLLNWLHQQHSAVGASSVVCTLHQACVISVLPVILLYCWNEDKIGDPDRWSIGDLDWWICAMVTFDSIVLLKRQSWSRSVLSCHGDVWFYCIWSCAMVSCNFIVLLKWRQKLVIGSNDLMTCVWLQPKGADRKHKTDREKMEKRSEAEKVSADAAFCCVHGVIIVAEPSGWERTHWL